MTRTIRALATLLGAACVLAPGIALAAGGEHGFVFSRDGFYIIDFVVFALLLWLFLKGPAKTFLANRHDRVKGELAQAERAKKRAELQLQEAEAKVAGLSSEIETLRAEIAALAEREREQILGDGADQAAAIRAGAARRIEQEAANARAGLEAEFTAKVLAAAEKKIASQMTGKHQRELFNRYIKGLEELDQLDQFAA